jgi:glycosyltransferase involved in cell wall biosynthesis
MTDQTPDQQPQAERQPPAPPPPQKQQDQRRQQRAQQQQRQQQRQHQPRGESQEQHHNIDLSVVIPLLNEEGSLRELHQQLRHALGRMNLRYEILFIDDGSTDRSFFVLRDLKHSDRHVRVIRFRRNNGKSAALAVGFAKAQGHLIVTMDADLQDDPSEIPALRRKIEEGYDLVSGWKKVRHDPITKTIPSRLFNFIVRRFTGIRIHDFNCGLKIYRHDVVKSVRVYGELHRYIPVLAHWDGFKVGEQIVQHRARKYGKTKFGLGRFWKGFLDLITVLFTTRYLRRPLHLFGFWGMVAAFAGFVVLGWLTVEKLAFGAALSNRPLFLLGILLFIVGIQFISIGLIGEMISRSQAQTEEYQIRDFLK